MVVELDSICTSVFTSNLTGNVFRYLHICRSNLYNYAFSIMYIIKHGVCVYKW